MSASSLKCIYLGSDGKLAVKDVTETHKPQESQALIRVHYSGMNPCDLNFFYVGLHSYVTGFELSGTVEETGSSCSFKVGDTVCGLSPVALHKLSCVGTHQDLAIAEANLLYAVPPGLKLKDAGVIIVVSHTAIDALFNGLGFGLPAAKVTGTDPKDRPILIWGGASSVGIVAIQIAKAVGFNPIFTTALTKNHDVLERLGATQCFDYKSPSVVDDIRAAAKAQGITLGTAFVTVNHTPPGAAVEQSSPALAKKAMSDIIAPEDLKLVCTNPVPGPSFKFCVAYRPSGSIDSFGGPQNPEAPVRVRKAMEYFLESSERTIQLPNVKIVKGAEADIREIERVAKGDVSMEKVVIAHPL